MNLLRHLALAAIVNTYYHALEASLFDLFTKPSSQDVDIGSSLVSGFHTNQILGNIPAHGQAPTPIHSSQMLIDAHNTDEECNGTPSMDHTNKLKRPRDFSASNDGNSNQKIARHHEMEQLEDDHLLHSAIDAFKQSILEDKLSWPPNLYPMETHRRILNPNCFPSSGVPSTAPTSYHYDPYEQYKISGSGQQAYYDEQQFETAQFPLDSTEKIYKSDADHMPNSQPREPNMSNPSPVEANAMASLSENQVEQNEQTALEIEEQSMYILKRGAVLLSTLWRIGAEDPTGEHIRQQKGDKRADKVEVFSHVFDNCRKNASNWLKQLQFKTVPKEEDETNETKIFPVYLLYVELISLFLDNKKPDAAEIASACKLYDSHIEFYRNALKKDEEAVFWGLCRTASLQTSTENKLRLIWSFLTVWLRETRPLLFRKIKSDRKKYYGVHNNARGFFDKILTRNFDRSPEITLKNLETAALLESSRSVGPFFDSIDEISMKDSNHMSNSQPTKPNISNPLPIESHGKTILLENQADNNEDTAMENKNESNRILERLAAFLSTSQNISSDNAIGKDITLIKDEKRKEKVKRFGVVFKSCKNNMKTWLKHFQLDTSPSLPGTDKSLERIVLPVYLLYVEMISIFLDKRKPVAAEMSSAFDSYGRHVTFFRTEPIKDKKDKFWLKCQEGLKIPTTESKLRLIWDFLGVWLKETRYSFFEIIETHKRGEYGVRKVFKEFFDQIFIQIFERSPERTMKNIENIAIHESSKTFD